MGDGADIHWNPARMDSPCLGKPACGICLCGFKGQQGRRAKPGPPQHGLRPERRQAWPLVEGPLRVGVLALLGLGRAVAGGGGVERLPRARPGRQERLPGAVVERRCRRAGGRSHVGGARALRDGGLPPAPGRQRPCRRRREVVVGRPDACRPMGQRGRQQLSGRLHRLGQRGGPALGYARHLSQALPGAVVCWSSRDGARVGVPRHLRGRRRRQAP
mmetsp:Transcript_49875/g.100405  ORF Transcript_49875/g.100405 Transcript_49875/m.100405 type:complete len:217 (+) Transcript_49875:242-892(+)